MAEVVIDIAVLGAAVHLAVGDERRGPDAAVGGVGPEDLSIRDVDAVDVPVVFRLIEQALVEAGRGNRAADRLVRPHGLACDVASGGEIQATDHADAVAVLRVLADDHVGAALVHDDGGDDLARAVVGRVLQGLAVLRAVLGRIGVVAEELLERGKTLRVLERIEVETVAKTVAAAPDDGGHAFHVGEGRRAPAGVQRAL